MQKWSYWAEGISCKWVQTGNQESCCCSLLSCWGGNVTLRKQVHYSFMIPFLHRENKDSDNYFHL